MTDQATDIRLTLYQTLPDALARIATLEDELEACAEVLQRLHPIGQVKGIGLLECAEAMRQVEASTTNQPTTEQSDLRAKVEGLKRFDPADYGVAAHPEGDWVRYADVLALLAAPQEVKPVTEEWLRSVGIPFGGYAPVLEVNGPFERIGVFAAREFGPWQIWLGENQESGVWCREVKSTADVLNLLAALGIKTQGTET